MKQLHIIIVVGLTLCLTSCSSQGPPSGNNVGGGGSGSDGIAYQHFRHNMLWAVTAWEVDAKKPVLVIFRIENVSTGLMPVVDKGTIIGEDHRRGLKIMDNARKNNWVQINYDDSPQTMTILGEPQSLDDGRIFIIDTVDTTSTVTQLDGPIPFEIPQSPTDEDSEPIKVLFAVQKLADTHAPLKAFLQQHEGSIEYVNWIRQQRTK